MDEFSKAAGSAYTRGHPPTWKPGDGSFDLLQNIRALPTHVCLPGYWSMCSLMSCLVVMHFIWYYLLARILWQQVCKDKTLHEGGEDTYEGDSDDDEGKKRK